MIVANLELNVDFQCIETKERGFTKLELESKKDTSVRDLKLAIQDLLNAPACDLSVLYDGQSLNDDRMPLLQLHFRECDRLAVEFLVTADISSMKELISNLRLFSQSVAHLNSDFIDVLAISLNAIQFDQVKTTLRRLSLQFIPWKNSRSIAHRHYFVQEGGFDVFMDIFRFSTKTFKGDISQGEEDSTLNDQLTVYNGHQKALNILCLRLLWNFGETREDRNLVLSQGAQKPVLEALLLDPDKKFPYAANGVFSRIVSYVNQEAVGCLAGMTVWDLQGSAQTKKPNASSLHFLMIEQENLGSAMVKHFASRLCGPCSIPGCGAIHV